MTTDHEKADGAAPLDEATTDGSGESVAPKAPSVAPAAPSTPPPEPSLEQKLAEGHTETARLREQLLRTAADFDNFRKRTRRSEEDAQRRGREGMLKDLLPVFDNLERAAQHADSATEAQAVASGLRMVLKQFTDTLEKSGIKRIVAVGHPFDPTRHEAIQQLDSKDHPAGVVMAEVQPGYTMGDTLIRAAMVVVSKGPPEEVSA